MPTLPVSPSFLPACLVFSPHEHWGRRLASLLRSAMASFQSRRELRAAEASLSGLDDRMLKDIGFHRSEIQSVLLDSDGERTVGASSLHLRIRTNADPAKNQTGFALPVDRTAEGCPRR